MFNTRSPETVRTNKDVRHKEEGIKDSQSHRPDCLPKCPGGTIALLTCHHQWDAAVAHGKIPQNSSLTGSQPENRTQYAVCFAQ